MTPKSADPSRYKLHVVSFSVVREAAPEHQPRSKLNDPNAVAHLARQIIADDAKEHFWALLLDSQNGLLAAHEVSTGTLSASLVHPREVFGPALRVLGVASVVLIHNHPSGDVTPSREDLRLTRQWRRAGCWTSASMITSSSATATATRSIGPSPPRGQSDGHAECGQRRRGRRQGETVPGKAYTSGARRIVQAADGEAAARRGAQTATT